MCSERSDLRRFRNVNLSRCMCYLVRRQTLLDVNFTLVVILTQGPQDLLAIFIHCYLQADRVTDPQHCFTKGTLSWNASVTGVGRYAALAPNSGATLRSSIGKNIADSSTSEFLILVNLVELIGFCRYLAPHAKQVCGQELCLPHSDSTVVAELCGAL